jgi:hypothetical protein
VETSRPISSGNRQHSACRRFRADDAQFGSNLQIFRIGTAKRSCGYRGLLSGEKTGSWEERNSMSNALPEVNSLGPNPQRLIALLSPGALLETGLRMCLPEKRQVIDLLRRRAVRSLQSGLSRNNREIRAFSAYFGGRGADFLCSADCVAEQVRFELSLPFRIMHFACLTTVILSTSGDVLR